MSTLRRNRLPSEQWLDIMLAVKRTDIASMELSNSRLCAIAKASANVLPLHYLMRLGIEPTNKARLFVLEPSRDLSYDNYWLTILFSKRLSACLGWYKIG